jgi:D-glycero-D-manno-heptose 1,7-bisphosphate phosphatase
MKRAAVFFDRDNTLIANDGYLGDPNGVVLVEGAADAIARAREMGYAVVVFSNQSGVARGMFTEEAVHAVNHRMDEMLLDENAHAVIDRHEFCPFHAEATVERYREDSELRKPKPGMILQAERQLALDLPRSWVIGDAARDMDAGKTAGCRTILVKNPNLPSSPDAMAIGSTTPDYEVASLREAVEVIAQNHAPVQVEPAPVVAAANEENVVQQVSGDVSEKESESEETAEAVKPAVKPAVTPVVEATVEQRDVESAVEQRDPDRTDESTSSESPSHEPRPRSRTSLRELETTDDDGARVAPPRGKSRQEILLGQILDELKRQHERPADDFSVSMLMAGVVQVIAFGCLFWAYIHRGEMYTPGFSILVGIFMQVFTIALLLWGRQK